MIELNTMLFFVLFLLAGVATVIFFRSTVTATGTEEVNGVVGGIICAVLSFLFLVLYLMQIGVVVK